MAKKTKLMEYQRKRFEELRETEELEIALAAVLGEIADGLLEERTAQITAVQEMLRVKPTLETRLSAILRDHGASLESIADSCWLSDRARTIELAHQLDGIRIAILEP